MSVTNLEWKQTGIINLAVENYKLSVVLFNDESALKEGAYLCLYNGDIYKGLCSNADIIYNVVRSYNGKSFAYIQQNYDSNTIELIVYCVNMLDMSIEITNSITLDADLCDQTQHYVLFSPDNNYVIFKCEWNHIYIINLITNAVTEFFIPNSRTNYNPQVLYTVGIGLQSHASGTDVSLNSRPDSVSGLELSVNGMGEDNCIVWFGYDEYVRVIDLSSSTPTLWRDKLIYTIRDYQLQTKYFVLLPGNYLLFMDIYNKTSILKINNKAKQLEFVYDIAYPAIGYDDIQLNGYKVLFLNDKFTCTIDLIDKSCRVKKNINAIAK